MIVSHFLSAKKTMSISRTVVARTGDVTPGPDLHLKANPHLTSVPECGTRLGGIATHSQVGISVYLSRITNLNLNNIINALCNSYTYTVVLGSWHIELTSL